MWWLSTIVAQAQEAADPITKAVETNPLTAGAVGVISLVVGAEKAIALTKSMRKTGVGFMERFVGLQGENVKAIESVAATMDKLQEEMKQVNEKLAVLLDRTK